MAKLLYSARTADGQSTSGFVQAASARDARDQLVRAGLTDVVLHQEPAIGMEESQLAGLSPAATRQLAQFRLRLMRNPGLATVLQEVARRCTLWLVVDGVMLAWGLWSDRWLLVGAAVALLAFPFLATVWGFRHADRYQQLLKAYSLGRWAQVEALIDKLGSARKRSLQLDFDLDVRRACIRARQGQLAEALGGLESWRSRLAEQRGLYEGRVAAVCASAEDRPGFLRLMGEAHAASGGEPARALDCALAQARFGDVQQAEDMLASVDTALLPPHAKGFVLWTRGVLALRKGESESEPLLAQATAEFLARGDQPAVWTSLAFCACDHAIALHRLGRRDQARLTLNSVLPILRAHADKPLMEMLNNEVLATTPAD
ncbi:hypothetical protein [Piscinibacter sp.]|jgi:hypothetical protein|uniref:hypothetical protein n=1 Tax=Piscinibacter sp. TaxID=1903157 RepID=UPI002F3F2D82